MRNAFRNTIRTTSIVAILGLSIGLALAMLVARQAVDSKITSVKSSVGNTVSISPAGVRGFEGGGEALTSDQIAQVAALSHITKVDQMLGDRLTSSNTNLESAVDAGSLGKRFLRTEGASPSGAAPVVVNGDSANGQSFKPPVSVLGTTTPTKLEESQGGGTFTLKSGTVFASDSEENVAVIGSSLATKNNLSVGSTFTAYGQTIKVVAIFDAGNTFANNQVMMPLKTLQTLSDQKGEITSATATVDSISNVTSVSKAIAAKLGDKADVTNSADQVKESIAPLENIKTISTYSLLGAIVAGSVIILLTMVMIVRERRREIGVLKAIGASNGAVVGQFATEAITLTGISAVFGIAVGAIAANPITKSRCWRPSCCGIWAWCIPFSAGWPQ
jgi:putative ABC transport system permease protein